MPMPIRSHRLRVTRPLPTRIARRRSATETSSPLAKTAAHQAPSFFDKRRHLEVSSSSPRISASAWAMGPRGPHRGQFLVRSREDDLNDTTSFRRKTASDFPQELLELYDYYVHGRITKREFLERATRFAVGGVTAVALLQQ